MSVGAAIVARDTAPVREVIMPGETGQLVDFFDRAGLVRSIGALLDDAGERQRLGAAARAFAQSRYDLGRVCLPQQLAWVQSLSAGL
jgi:glycosyltransferase involved in cell wall biosynthesis